jgi:phage FluMu gp28-like protein
MIGVDEAAIVGNLEYAWEYVMRPTLIDYGGRALFASTPKGRNFFWRLFRREDEGEADWRSWQLPTTVNTTLPNLDEEIKATKAGLPEMTFRQEVLAEFVEDSVVFRNVQSAVDTKVAARPPVEGHRYVAGVDLARLEDFTVVTVMDVSTAPREVAFVDRFNQVSWQAQRDRIREVITRYKIEVVFIDQTGVGDPVVEQLRRDVAIRLLHGVQFTSTNKSPMVEALMLAFERGEVRLLDYPPMTAELLAYDAERLPSGAMRYNAPSGQHDDCVVSLMLAWEAAGRQRVGRLVA